MDNHYSDPHYFVKCGCCGKDYIYESAPMIKDELWKRITSEHWEGGRWIGELLCLPCMERKLGRKITPADFGDYAGSWHNEEFLKRHYASG